MAASGFPDVTTVESCYHTIVRNISGIEMSFGFLGTHGKRLAAGAHYSVRGDIRDRLAKKARSFEAFERAVAGYTDQAGNAVAATLAVETTPAVHLYDATLHVGKVLTLANGTLGKADSCAGAYTST